MSWPEVSVTFSASSLRPEVSVVNTVGCGSPVALALASASAMTFFNLATSASNASVGWFFNFASSTSKLAFATGSVSAAIASSS